MSDRQELILHEVLIDQAASLWYLYSHMLVCVPLHPCCMCAGEWEP
jgi:hypothetical protein